MNVYGLKSQFQVPGHFILGEKAPGTHSVEVCVGPRVTLYVLEKKERL